ncbi:MAG: NYN domain-containing protein [Chlamydiota bacterium]
MQYYIDGYNLIFTLVESKESLQILRRNVIRLLQKKFAQLKLSGMVVFDGAHRKDEESGLSYPSPLIVAYTAKGETADVYIVEHIERSRTPKQITVITNDRGLSLHAGAAGAKVQSNADFIDYLKKKGAKNKDQKIAPRETKQNIDRLLKIFEERLHKNLDDE